MPSHINPVQNFIPPFVNILIFSGRLGQAISGSSTLQAFEEKQFLFFALFQASCVLRATLSLKKHSEERVSLIYKFSFEEKNILSCYKSNGSSSAATPVM